MKTTTVREGGWGAFERDRSGGFTLVELVVALTVVAVAMTGLIAMFNSALHLAGEARNRVLAAELAETQLVALAVSPEIFLWQVDASADMFPITLGLDDPRVGNMAQTPEVRLAARAAQDRNEALYRRFRWKAWGRLPSPDANHYEISVLVQWSERGRSRGLALTSSVARARVDVFASESAAL